MKRHLAKRADKVKSIKNLLKDCKIGKSIMQYSILRHVWNTLMKQYPDLKLQIEKGLEAFVPKKNP